jgi:hypothetical protein
MNEDYEFEGEFESASHGGGYFPGIWMPPLVVILIGLLIGVLASGILVSKTTASVLNSALPLNNDPNLEAAMIAIPGNSYGNLSGLFTPEVLFWRKKIIGWSENTGLDPNLIATVMQIESCGDPRALSSAGAMGLFQVMPFHFNASDDPYEPETNALRGMAYLRQSLDASNGDARLAFAGYNGGISVIHKSELNWAAETQRYAYWGSGIYDEAIQGLDVSLRLQEWIARGGASLCRQAADRLGIDP